MTRTIRLVCIGLGLGWACEPEKPPAPQLPAGAAGTDPQESPVYFEPGAAAVLTYAGKRGQFKDASDMESIPEEARGMVRVMLLGGARPPANAVWVANLRTPEEGKYRLNPVPRDLFEELAVGEGRSSAVELPEGLEPPKVISREGIIVYKTDWCGVCKKLESYLRRKGVEYVAKDVEKDAEAAAELQAKAREKGIKTGSVPVIDVGGELMVGFDRARLEQLLG